MFAGDPSPELDTAWHDLLGSNTPPFLSSLHINKTHHRHQYPHHSSRDGKAGPDIPGVCRRVRISGYVGSISRIALPGKYSIFPFPFSLQTGRNLWLKEVRIETRPTVGLPRTLLSQPHARGVLGTHVARRYCHPFLHHLPSSPHPSGFTSHSLMTNFSNFVIPHRFTFTWCALTVTIRHPEHCIELLRQAAICKGDTSVTSFKWLRNNTSEPTTKEGVLHRCVNWDQLSGWARERRVDLFNPGLLVREGAGE